MRALRMIASRAEKSFTVISEIIYIIFRDRNGGWLSRNCKRVFYLVLVVLGERYSVLTLFLHFPKLREYISIESISMDANKKFKTAVIVKVHISSLLPLIWPFQIEYVWMPIKYLIVHSSKERHEEKLREKIIRFVVLSFRVSFAIHFNVERYEVSLWWTL